MARHSKWHKVKQFKGAIDAKRSASFTKLGREIAVAAREKGADPEVNARLRAAIQKARETSMPKENIERAIQKGSGSGTEGFIETLTYEAYAPGGTALVIEALTDNRNRTANDVKHLLSKNGASLAMTGSVTYLFDRVGVIRIQKGFPSAQRETCELAVIDAGATHIIDDEGVIELHTHPNELGSLAVAVVALGCKTDTAEFQWVPKALVETDEHVGMQVTELIEQLEEHDDVSRVFSNLA